MDLKQIYSQILMQHARSSDYKHPMEDATWTERGHNPSCGDDITLSVKLDGDRIEKAAFEGHGCAISMASTSLLCESIEGLTLEEAQNKVDCFLQMIMGEEKDPEVLEETLGDAVALQDISHMPQRVKCAVLAWRTLEDLIREKKENAGK